MNLKRKAMNQVICPKCDAVLNPENKVILSARKNDGKWGLILLSSQLGNYSVINHECFQIAEGESVKFYCPACHVSLSDYAPKNQLVGLEIIEENNQKHTILISAVAGEKCTYKIVDGEIKSYGKDATKYRFDYQNLVDLL